jgi:hypothetical protein
MRGRFITSSLLALLVAGLLSARDAGAQDTPARPSAARIDSIRASYAAFPATILRVHEPIQVLWSDIYLDGGTQGLRFSDATSRIIKCCLDQRIHDPLDDPSPHLMYFGVEYPDPAHGVLIRGPEESALYGLLIRYVQAHAQWDSAIDARSVLLAGSEGARFPLVRRLLSSLDRRFSTLGSE